MKAVAFAGIRSFDPFYLPKTTTTLKRLHCGAVLASIAVLGYLLKCDPGVVIFCSKINWVSNASMAGFKIDLIFSYGLEMIH